MISSVLVLLLWGQGAAGAPVPAPPPKVREIPHTVPVEQRALRSRFSISYQMGPNWLVEDGPEETTNPMTFVGLSLLMPVDRNMVFGVNVTLGLIETDAKMEAFPGSSELSMFQGFFAESRYYFPVNEIVSPYLMIQGGYMRRENNSDAFWTADASSWVIGGGGGLDFILPRTGMALGIQVRYIHTFWDEHEGRGVLFAGFALTQRLF